MPVYINGRQLGGGAGVVGLGDLVDVILTSPQPGDLLEFSGSSFVNVAPSSLLGDSVSVVSSTLLASSDTFVNCETDVSGGNIVIDMPPSISAGEIHWVKDSGLNANVNSIIIDGNGNLIDGQAQVTIENAGGELRITGHANGNKWTLG